MNLMDEIRNIDKFFESMSTSDFDDILMRNGINDCKYMKDHDAMFYLEHKEYESIVNKLKKRKDEYIKDMKLESICNLYDDMNGEAA